MVKLTKAAAVSTIAGLAGLVMIFSNPMQNSENFIQDVTTIEYRITNQRDTYNILGKGPLYGSLLTMSYLSLTGKIREP